MRNLPALLVIMDGLGWAEASDANAVSLASTPNLDALMATYPHTTLGASGPDVGLPEGQMGNSEVGHLNIGAGRVVMQELMRINHAVETGELLQNAVLCETFDAAAASGATVHLMGLLSDGGVHSSMDHCLALLSMAAARGVGRVRIHAFLDAASGATVHLMGLLSDGGVHSSMDHCLALLSMAAARGVGRVRIHAFLDGRDVAPGTGIEYVERLAATCANVSEQNATCDARIGSVAGRYYAMDRDNRWERVKRAWDAIVLGRGSAVQPAAQGVRASYDQGVTDEFVVPFPCEETGVADGDAVVFFNFRPDRARELTRAFTDPQFDGFERGRVPRTAFVTMTEYDPSFAVEVAFPKTNPEHVLADVLAEEGLRQLHTAETEKYAHVTFFINGGVESPKAGEERVLVNSPKVATYDLQPEMSAPEVAEGLAEAIGNDEADVYVVNFANPDMVGHTGILEAAVKAVEATDEALGRVVDAVRAKGGVALITADHGNADCMFTVDSEGNPAVKAVEATDEALGRVVDAVRAKGGVALITADHGNADCMFTVDSEGNRKPMTAHTLARVPFVVVADGVQLRDDVAGRLCDIAPTLLDLVGIEKPECWTGESLLKHPGVC